MFEIPSIRLNACFTTSMYGFTYPFKMGRFVTVHNPGGEFHVRCHCGLMHYRLHVSPQVEIQKSRSGMAVALQMIRLYLSSDQDISCRSIPAQCC
ncbi:hypothetical protein X975_14236, partial [Stegodyphus mimosarum]